MPDLKISELTQDTTPATTDQVALERGGSANFRSTLAEVGTAIGAMSASLFDANTILKADTDDTPAALTVAEQTLVGRITSGVITALTATQVRTLLNVEDGADVTDATNVNAAGAVMEADFDANTILKADSDDTPAALTVAEQRLVGRITGGVITALTAAEVRTLINVEDGATAGGATAASQAEVDAGTVTDEYVSPDTLANKAPRAPVTINDTGVSAYTISDAAVNSATGFDVGTDFQVDQQDATADSVAYTVGTAAAGSLATISLRSGQDCTLTGSGVTLTQAAMQDGTATLASVTGAPGARALALWWVTSTYVVLVGGDADV